MVYVFYFKLEKKIILRERSAFFCLFFFFFPVSWKPELFRLISPCNSFGLKYLKLEIFFLMWLQDTYIKHSSITYLCFQLDSTPLFHLCYINPGYPQVLSGRSHLFTEIFYLFDRKMFSVLILGRPFKGYLCQGRNIQNVL